MALVAENVTKTGAMLELGDSATATNYQRLLPPTFTTTKGSSLASPYMSVRYTLPREIGLNAHYAAASRRRDGRDRN